MSLKLNRKQFFDCYREAYGSLDQSQVEAIDYLLTRFESETRVSSVPQFGYILATTKHETADTFLPVKEYGMKQDSDGRWYNVVNRRKVYRRYGHWFGRGFVQITWESNYVKFGKLLDKDLAGNPDLALDPDTAYEILIIGMTRGLFTGKKLSDYINSKETDFTEARRIVNGTDRAAHIARLAATLTTCLKASLVQVPATTTPEHATPPLPDSRDDEGVTKTQDVAPSPTGEEKSGEPAPDSPAKPGEAIVGGRPEDPPKQASQGGLKSLWATISGAGVTTGMAVVAWFKDNSNAAVVLIICATVLILVFMFRQILMDWLRMKMAADPSKYNIE